MIEKVINGNNMRKACRKVMSNKGSAGIDGMSTHELSAYLGINREQLAIAIEGMSATDGTSVRELAAAFETKREQIGSAMLTGSYQPQAILGAEIPKDNGKIRLLGIPTVIDRMLQQAVHQVIYPKFEIEFKTYSYGFRPKRNAHQAVLQAQKNINEGYQHIVDIDLKNFFDEVDHCILLQLLYRKIKCPLTLRLIRKWLRAPILIKGKLTKRRKGVPQGSPLSPLLSNIMLHELDKELERRELRYVRYADDFSIYTKGNLRAREIL
jgi:group II intron reverse transcriptase/maturase